MRYKVNRILQSLFVILGITIPVSVAATNLVLGLIIFLWILEGNIRLKIKSMFSEKWIIFLFIFFCWNILAMFWGENHNNSAWIFQRLALLILFPVLITVNFKKSIIKKSIVVLLATLVFISVIAILQDLSYIKHLSKYFSFINSVCLLKILNNPPHKRVESKNINLSKTKAPYYLYNIGNNKPISLEVFISAIENAVGRKAKKNYLPMQPGDVKKTFADISKLNDLYKYQPKTDIFQGIEKFVDWYKEYNSVN